MLLGWREHAHPSPEPEAGRGHTVQEGMTQEWANVVWQENCSGRSERWTMGQQRGVGTDISSSPRDDRSIEGLALTPTATSTAASSDTVPETTERRGGGRLRAWPSALSMLLGGQPSGSDK